MIVDTTTAARPADSTRMREWLAAQAGVLSSALADTSAERRAIARAVEEDGAQAAGSRSGRDADPEDAYLSEVDSSTIYVGIANEIYGRVNPPGYSATEAEYMLARERGKRLYFLVAADAPNREGHRPVLSSACAST